MARLKLQDHPGKIITTRYLNGKTTPDIAGIYIMGTNRYGDVGLCKALVSGSYGSGYVATTIHSSHGTNQYGKNNDRHHPNRYAIKYGVTYG